jgi:hypothetical protein
MQLLFRLSGLVPAETKSMKNMTTRDDIFPSLLVAYGSSRGAVTKRLSGHNVAQLRALWRGRLLACLRHGRLDKAHGV